MDVFVEGNVIVFIVLLSERQRKDNRDVDV